MALDESGSVGRTTLVIGEWQEEYFRTKLGLSAKANIATQTVQFRNSPLSRNLWFLRGLPKLAERLRADVVHLAFPVPVIRHSYKCPVVATLHDLYPYDIPSNFGYPNALFVRTFLRNCLAGADAIACVSSTTQNRLGQFNRRFLSKSVVIPNAARLNSVTSKRPQALCFENYVLSVAQHRQNKNLSLAIRGFAKARATGVLPRQTGLVIVGAPGPETARLRDSVREWGIGDSVRFLSSLRDPELRWLYEHCALFLVTSTHEGFCLPLAEALTFGCPIACSDIPILREIGGSDCCYFELNDRSEQNVVAAVKVALAKARRALASDNNALAERGRRYAELYSNLTGTSIVRENTVPSCS